MIESPTVFYDADCGFCLWCVAKVIALDRSHSLRYRPIQDPASVGPLGAIPEGQRLGSWHLATQDGTVYSAGRAFVPLLRTLPRSRAASSALAHIPPALLDRAYYAVAARRTAAGRLLTAGARRRSRATVLSRGA